MKLLRPIIVLAVTLGLPLVVFSQSSALDAERSQRIAQWGSSVSNGTGDELDQGGYAGRLQNLLESRGWQLFNQSRGGDNTVTITSRFEPGDEPEPNTKYLTDVDPAYVVIGLSLGNEGITRCRRDLMSRCTNSTEEADAIFQQFANGMQRLIRRSRAAGITPVVTLPYARSDFSELEYAYTRQMNLLINTWDVPSVNMLGAIDDGQGRWARGFYRDARHPNAAGHTEMFHAFVPSLFDALAAGKSKPVKSDAQGFVRVVDDRPAPLSFEVEDTMRSFALTFIVRIKQDGVIAGVIGRLVDHKYDVVRTSRSEIEWDSEAVELMPTGDRFQTTISVQSGRLIYSASSGNHVSAPLQEIKDGWHYVTLTHYVARAQTLVYVDAELVGIVAERLQPELFVLGGSGVAESADISARADYKQWMLHRAGLNADEVVAVHNGSLLQASLEIYAPLSDRQIPTENIAQSLSEIKIDPSVKVVNSGHD